MAPEMLDGNYNELVDEWSLGVLLYVLVSGYLPFQGKSSNEVFRKIKLGKFHFDHVEFKNVSKECIDLITKLLQVDPEKRLHSANSLKHKWFNIVEDMQEDRKLSEAVIQRFRSFKGISQFKRAAMNMLIKTINQSEVEDLRYVFEKMDEDKSGMISAQELGKYLKERNMGMS